MDSESIQKKDLRIFKVSENEIEIINTQTGKIISYDIDKLRTPYKYKRRGRMLYCNTFKLVLDKLTNTEAKLIMSIANEYIDLNNIMTVSFSKATPKFDASRRSKFKKKLLENQIIEKIDNKIILNPYVFIPSGDKNIHNSIYLTQHIWDYLFIDKDKEYDDEVVSHVYTVFGDIYDIINPQSTKKGTQ